MTEPLIGSQSRVKLYELSSSGRWDDRGTGYISQVEKPVTEGVHIVLVCEETGRILHDHRINSRIEYVQQGQTIITWPEEHGKDVALSYQDASQCNATWQYIYDIVHANYNVNNDGLLLPELTLETLPSICEIIEKACICNRDELGPILRTGSFQEGLISQSRVCVDSGDISSCYLVFRIVKSIFLSGDSVLIDDLTVPPYIQDQIKIFEYDPENHYNSGDQQCFTRHQEYLSHVLFKNACVITDEEVIDRIHQSFVLTYIRDVALLEYLDDFSISRITTLKYQKENAIVTRLIEAGSFVHNLFLTLERLAVYTPSMQHTPSCTSSGASPVQTLQFSDFSEFAPTRFTSFISKTQRINADEVPLERLMQSSNSSAVLSLEDVHAIVSTEASHRVDVIELIYHILQLSKSTQIITRTSFVQLQLENNFCLYAELMLSTTPRSSDSRQWPAVSEVLSLLLHNDLQATKASLCALTSGSSAGAVNPLNYNTFFPLIFSGILSVHTNEGVKLLLNDIVRRLFNTLDASEPLSRAFLNLYQRQLALALDYNVEPVLRKDEAMREEVYQATRTVRDNASAVRLCSMVRLLDFAGPEAILTSDQLLTCVTCSFTEEPIEPRFVNLYITPVNHADIVSPTIHVLGLLSYILRPLLTVSPTTQSMITKAIINSCILERAKTLVYSILGTFLAPHTDIAALDQIENPVDMVRVVKEQKLPLLSASETSVVAAVGRFVKVVQLCSDAVLIRHIIQLRLVDILLFVLIINGQRQNVLSGTIWSLLETCDSINEHHSLTLQCRVWRDIFNHVDHTTPFVNRDDHGNASSSISVDDVYLADQISEPSIPTDLAVDAYSSAVYVAYPYLDGDVDTSSEDSDHVDQQGRDTCALVGEALYPSVANTPQSHSMSLPSSAVEEDSDDDIGHEADELASFMCLTSSSPTNMNITAPKLTLSLRASSSSIDDLQSPRSESPCISPPQSPSTFQQASPQRSLGLQNATSPLKRVQMGDDSIIKRQRRDFMSLIGSSSSMNVSLTLPTASQPILNQGTLLPTTSTGSPTNPGGSGVITNTSMKMLKLNIQNIIKPSKKDVDSANNSIAGNEPFVEEYDDDDNDNQEEDQNEHEEENTPSHKNN